MTAFQQRALGGSGLSVSPQGVGTMSWGPGSMWGYGKSHTADDVAGAYKVLVDSGVNFFDTAENYGHGESERLLGKLLREDGRPVVVATKFLPKPTRLSADTLAVALDASLARLGLDAVDLYQIHTPAPHLKVEALMDAMAKAVTSGKIRAVGVSNYGAGLMRRAHARLAEHGIPLASNEVHYSLLHRNPERNGVLDACRELDVALIAASPLEMGVLTGKYRSGKAKMPLSRRLVMRSTGLDPSGDTGGPNRLTAGGRALRPTLVEPVFAALDEVANNRSTSVQAVALNWLSSMDERVIPIPGAKNRSQATAGLASLGWRLTEQEVARLCRAAETF